MYAVKQVIYRNFSPETFKNWAILQTFASLPEKKFHESGIRHGIFRGLYFGRGIFSDLILSPFDHPFKLEIWSTPPGPLRLHPIIPKSFIFCFLGGGKPRELKKHKLNKIKGKCKKKKLFCHDMSLHQTPTPPPTFHRRTPGGQPSSRSPWRSLQYILTYSRWRVNILGTIRMAGNNYLIKVR